MDILQIILLAITSTLLYITLKDLEPRISFLIVFITSIFIFLFVIEQIKLMVQFIETIARKAHIEPYYIQTIFKIIGIAYITEISANIVSDVGLSSLAAKIQLAGKIFILLLSLPILQTVIEMMIELIPTGSNH